MSSTIVENVDTFTESKSFNHVKQEIDDLVDVKNEPIWGESIPRELYEEKKYIIDQINDYGKVSSEEAFLTTWNSHSIKTETSEDFNTENNSTAHIYSNLEMRNDFSEMRVERETLDSHMIIDQNLHMQNENTECIMTNIDNVSKLTVEKCDLKSMDSVKTETNENINTYEESKYNINQIILEDEKVWPKEDSSTSWNLNSVKMEKSEDFKTEYFKVEKEHISELLPSMQMEPSQSECKIPRNLDSINKPKKHKCHLCAYSTSHNRDLQMHMKAVHLKLKNHECTLCDYSTLRTGHLQRHIKSVHLKQRNHKCDFCDHSSLSKLGLQRHIESIHLKLKTHTCHLCAYSACHKGRLQLHIKSVHLKLKNHKCHLCDFTSSWTEGLQKHMKSVHLKLKNFKCHLCDYSSSQKGDLQMHIKSVHLKFKNHKCDLCAYTSSRKAGLQKHINLIHLKPKKHNCQLCDFSSSQKRALAAHIKSEHS